jgi:hypothetical protein
MVGLSAVKVLRSESRRRIAGRSNRAQRLQAITPTVKRSPRLAKPLWEEVIKQPNPNAVVAEAMEIPRKTAESSR